MRIRPAAALVAIAALLAGCTDSPPRATPTPASSSAASPSASSSPAPSGPATPSATAPALRQGQPRLELVGRFDEPVYVTSPTGDARLFVVEKAGRIRVMRDGRVLPAPFLDVRDQVRSGGEQGLLSVAFAPDYATSGKAYVHYNDLSGDTRIVEYTVARADPNRLDPASRRELLRIDQPYSNHKGGLVLFDPTGMLLVGMGDGGSGGDPQNRAQDLRQLLGKLLRIDPRTPSGGRPYSIPPDNPFVRRSGARPEIWAYGLRNPWRFSFDQDTGDLYLGDVGQGEVEEIDVVAPGQQSGANYGWRAFEGDRPYSGEQIDTSRLVRPVLTYGHGGGACSVTGGVVYHGSVAALRGRYLFGDYCSGVLWSIPAGTARGPAKRTLPFGADSLSSFGVDAAGEVYVVSLGGPVWRITA